MTYQIKNAERELEVKMDVKLETEIQAPDGGWGWAVCFAAFMTNFSIVGMINSNGVILLGLLDLFNESVSKTSLVGAFIGGLTMFGGPLVLVVIFFKASHRQIMMVGGITAAASSVASAFAPTIEAMIFTYGILVGLSLAMNYFAANVILACYFDRKRALALGIANSGSGIGSFLLCYLIERSISFYGMRGTFLMIGGLFLNLTVYGSLCRPLKPVKSRHKIPVKRRTSKDRKEGVANLSFTSEEENTDMPIGNDAVPCRYSIGRNEQSNFTNLVSRYCDAVIFRNKTFGLLLAIYLLWAVGESALIYLPLYAESEGLTRADSAMIMSIFGIVFTLAPIVAGFLADVVHIPISYLLLFSTFGLSLSIVSIPFCKTFASLVSSTIVLSTSFSFGISLRIVLVTAVLGIEKMSGAFGIMTMLVGVGYTVYPIVTGIVYDATRSFPIIFYMNSAIASLGAILSCGVIYAEKTGKFVK